MSYEQIIYSVEDSILTVTLNRPDKLNAFTERMRQEFMDAFDQADEDDDVRAIIVTGAGRGFCAGADLSAGGKTFDRAARGGTKERWRDGGGLVSLRIFESKKPVIAAVNGPAVGVGVTMQLPMDIRIASTEARFGFVFSRRGVMPEACSGWFLPRIVGISQALEWVYSGRVFSAQEALEGRLVKKVVPPAELLPAARAIAREIADNTSAVSIAVSRQYLWRMLGADHPMEAHKIDSRGIPALGAGADAYEGVSSFLEKRKPKFTMRPSKDMPDFYPWWKDRPFE
ncbi:MAG TPA: crotonase/enoyl-CoA hydratase family protein [Candidatus Cybelea sp.]|nr:crotonase/enoyl-CoA hydratase family protein [Candidatus Cybelea sp.]